MTFDLEPTLSETNLKPHCPLLFLQGIPQDSTQLHLESIRTALKSFPTFAVLTGVFWLSPPPQIPRSFHLLSLFFSAVIASHTQLVQMHSHLVLVREAHGLFLLPLGIFCALLARRSKMYQDSTRISELCSGPCPHAGALTAVSVLCLRILQVGRYCPAFADGVRCYLCVGFTWVHWLRSQAD